MATTLGALGTANAIATLALEVGGILIPIIKGAVTKIEQIGSGASSVDYQVLITSDGKELDGVATVAISDLQAINAELVRLQQAALPVPAAPPATP